MMTERLIDRVEKVERFLKLYTGPRNPLMPTRVWRAYMNARLRYLLSDIVFECRRIEEKERQK